MSKFAIEKYSVGYLGANCYFFINNETKEMVIIDPGGDGSVLAKTIHQRELIPVAILLTHAHFDHSYHANLLGDEFGIPIYVHEEDWEVLSDPSLNLSKQFDCERVLHGDKKLKDGDILVLAGAEWRVLWTPGHTMGGVCYYIASEKVLFSGDTIFTRSIGRTDFQNSSMEALMDSIYKKLLVLPDDTRILPGHMMETCVGKERKYNPYLQNH